MGITKSKAISTIAYAGIPDGARLLHHEQGRYNCIEVDEHTSAMLGASCIRDSLHEALAGKQEEQELDEKDFDTLLDVLTEYPIIVMDGLKKFEDEQRAQIRNCIQKLFELRETSKEF